MTSASLMQNFELGSLIILALALKIEWECDCDVHESMLSTRIFFSPLLVWLHDIIRSLNYSSFFLHSISSSFFSYLNSPLRRPNSLIDILINYRRFELLLHHSILITLDAHFSSMIVCDLTLGLTLHPNSIMSTAHLPLSCRTKIDFARYSSLMPSLVYENANLQIVNRKNWKLYR